MIVKNESRIIRRLLESVRPIIDSFCICDTGSIDNTVEIIQDWSKETGISGEVYTEAFQNFGYNRTHALERASLWGTYVLLLDADMKLVITPEFNKSELTVEGYAILQKNGTLEYYNTRIIKTGIGAKCIGPTHEYYDFPVGSKHGIKLKTLWINDIGDGGCKSDKYTRDIRLLSEALEKDPNNPRYLFYLAQSYNHSGNAEKAFDYYKKRYECGGWIEEVFYAALEAGRMALLLKRDADAIYWWLTAFNHYPKRSESVYELAKYYRERKNNQLSQIFADLGKSIPYPSNDVLFIKNACYEYLFDYENSINAYYTKRPIDQYNYIKLVATGYMRHNVLNNLQFYVKMLNQFDSVKIFNFNEKITQTISGRDDNFTSSSPCIIPFAEGYLMNTRFVNYTIQPNGTYSFKHTDGKITTLNKLTWLTRDFKELKTHWFNKVQDETLRYQGVEDVRLFPHCDSILFNGTVENVNSGSVTVGHGSIDLSSDKLIATTWISPTNRKCEKNWCYFHTDDGALRLIYDWYPLTIATPNDTSIDIMHMNTDVPAIFKELRGSSNGCLIDSEVWFLTHLVNYSTPRNYYHMIVVLDAKTLKFKRHSILFKFSKEWIEYSLGMIIEQSRVIFSHSSMDRTSSITIVPRKIFEEELFSSH